MFDKLLGIAAPDRVSEAFMWRWAEAHPYLYTVIKVSDPYLMVAVVFIGYHAIKRLVRR